MRKMIAVWVVLFLVTGGQRIEAQDEFSDGSFSPDQLDNLLAPIALYPDPLLAQVLLAATFPDEIDEAARFSRAGGLPQSAEFQPWDVSVKAIVHYPMVLYMMADKLDWTTSLGQAYVNQSTDVMTSVQQLRAEARSAGNLNTTPQEEVVEADGYLRIWPAQPQFLYVPAYDPAIVYFRHGGWYAGAAITFGAAFAIGAWLNHDCDWREHRVFYHGWEHGGGWVERSRPYVRITNTYVSNSYRNVTINRTVVSRPVNYGSLNRYQGVHRDVNFGRGPVRDDHRAVNNNETINNKIIQRNINTYDSRIDAHRGHAPEQPSGWGLEPNRPRGDRVESNEANSRPPARSQAPANNPHASRPADRGNTGAVFGGERGAFGASIASIRGQASRRQASPATPAPSPRPAPARDSERRHENR